jgi:hypothetical protein
MKYTGRLRKKGENFIEAIDKEVKYLHNMLDFIGVRKWSIGCKCWTKDVLKEEAIEARLRELMKIKIKYWFGDDASKYIRTDEDMKE